MRTGEYTGKRLGDGSTIVLTPEGMPLEPRLDVRSHSPTGFEWGYGGSGPAQLALAILCDAIGSIRAVEIYQRFKAECIALLEPESWGLDLEDVCLMALAIEREQRRAGEAR